MVTDSECWCHIPHPSQGLQDLSPCFPLSHPQSFSSLQTPKISIRGPEMAPEGTLLPASALWEGGERTGTDQDLHL